MPPDHGRSFGGGAAATTLSPIVLVAMVVAVILILILPKKYVIVPLFFVLFLVPISQQVFVGGVHLFVSRIVILFGLFRMLWTKTTSHGSILSGGLNSIDYTFLGCAICQGLAVILLFQNSDALVNQFGFFWDYLGGYFLLRFLLQDEEDIYRAIKCLAFLALILGVCMVRERLTLQDIFGYIGGKFTPEVRNGVARSEGPFAHELMAGAFGSTLLVPFWLLWKTRKAKAAAAFGLVGAALMTWTSGSSTSLMSFVAGIVAIFFWPFRQSMRLIRWGIVAGLVALQCVMKAPVWFLIARVDLTGSSSSYQRAELVDQFIRHFSDWWLIGVKSMGGWGWDLWDAQNQFVNVGETGGLLAFILFIAMISICFAKLGDARKAVAGDKEREWFLWLLGAALFSNVVAFFGVNYFDQTKFAWFALLAMISAATAPILRSSVAAEEVPNIAFGVLAHSSASSHSMARISRRESPGALRKPI